MRIEKILAPVDFSDYSRAGLEHALTLARAFGATVRVAHFIEPARYVTPGLMVKTADDEHVPVEDFGIQWGEREMDRLLEGMDLAGVPVDRAVRNGLPYEGICQMAREDGFDLLVMSSHGRTGFKRFLLGSVAERVLRGAHCPVLVVRGKGDEAGA